MSPLARLTSPLALVVTAVIAITGCVRNRAPSPGLSDTSVKADINAERVAGLSGRLTLTGSSTVAPLAAEIGKEFERLHPGVRVDVQTGGSSRGVLDARQGTADIGMVSRDLKPEESDLQAFTIARDGITLIIHAGNPVEALTRQQIVAIYTGQVRNWSDVGGADAPIVVVNKAEGRSTLELFLKFFDLETTDVHADIVIGDNEQAIKTVATTPNAIGYVSIGAAEYNAKHEGGIRLLPLDGVEASVENVRNGSFPLGRPLNLVVGEKPSGLVRAFIDFARSGRAAPMAEALYYVPLTR